MTEPGEADLLIADGRFAQARDIYSSLLDNDPENDSFIAGFYIASYWANRTDQINRLREGRARGEQLVTLFDQFEKSFGEKELEKTPALQAVTESILGDAAENFRISFQREGSLGLDKSVLISLVLCLLKTRDYKNAYEVLAYAGSFNETPKMKYYRAECLMHLGKKDEAARNFVRAFLANPADFEPDVIQSEPLEEIVAKMRAEGLSEGDLKEYFPVYCLEKGLFAPADLTEEEGRSLYLELLRLWENLKKTRGEFAFRVKCRLLHVGGNLLFHYNEASDNYRKVREILGEADKDFLASLDNLTLDEHL